MSEDDIRSVISRVMGVENSAAWDIVSSNTESNLYMVHHKPEANLSDYGQVRGIVVDTSAKTTVASSYGYTPTIVTDQLVIQSEDGKIQLIDELGLKHTVDPTRSLFKVGFEGTLINVFKHNGTVYRSTRKRLDPSRSRWGNSKTFMDMYWSLGGPTDDILFNDESKYSPYCHIFIVVHPDVLVVSKGDVGDGYIVYLGPKQMWSLDYNECPYKQVQKDGNLFPGITQEQFDLDPRPNAGWIDPDLHVPETITNMKDNVTYTNKLIYSPNNLSVEEANNHLQFGFYKPFEEANKLDRRMLPGEFVIIYQLDDKGSTTGLLRVESTSYSWRARMRDNDPNLRHRFTQLVSGSYILYDTDEGRDRYNSLYPTFEPFNEKTITSHINNSGPYVVWPQEGYYHSNTYLMDKESRMYNIWLAFLNSVPLHSQKEVSGYLNWLYNKRGELITWLRMLENSGNNNSSEYSRRVFDLISAAQNFAKRKAETGKNLTREGIKLSIKDMVRENFRNLIMKEEGTSLYRLITEMTRWKKEQEKQTTMN